MQTTSTSDFSGAAVGAQLVHSGQYLTLRLGREEYATDILNVQEIRSYEEPTRMAVAPPFIKGVINLRGVIVPIVDLRLKLNMETAEFGQLTVVVILRVHGVVIGAVVDSVVDVVTLDANSVKPAPQFESNIEAKFVMGIVTLGARTLMVMNMDTLLSPAEMGMVV